MGVVWVEAVGDLVPGRQPVVIVVRARRGECPVRVPPCRSPSWDSGVDPVNSSLRAVSCRILLTERASRFGSTSSIRAMMPVTIGAAALTAPAIPYSPSPSAIRLCRLTAQSDSGGVTGDDPVSRSGYVYAQPSIDGRSDACCPSHSSPMFPCPVNPTFDPVDVRPGRANDIAVGGNIAKGGRSVPNAPWRHMIQESSGLPEGCIERSIEADVRSCGTRRVFELHDIVASSTGAVEFD